MSLLLDALKKAEKAKDDAKRRAQASDAEDDGAPRQVRTRNDLPDISQPLEIHSEDIPGAEMPPDREAGAGGLSLAPSMGRTPRAPEPAEMPRNASADQAPRRSQSIREEEPPIDNQASQRAAAKNVFEAKFREPNPKLPFYITMAVLAVFAIGTVVYFWYQLRPPPALVNSNPKPPSGEKTVEKSDSRPTLSPTAQPAVPVAVPTAIPGLPAQPVTRAETPVAQSKASVAPPATPATTKAASAATDQPKTAAAPPESTQPSAARPRPESAQPPVRTRRTGTSPAAQQQAAEQTTEKASAAARLNVSRPAPQVNPKLEAGWLAYNQGNLQAARSNYGDVLRDEPANRDALLGMAALEVRSGRAEQAESLYRKLLESDPRDPYAQAGLFALRAQFADPVRTESQAKNMLSSDPQAYVLYFTLGNQYAQQGRWPEAQQAFFKAFSADSENPDFAYNLAVSLDHVRQPKLALEYYRRAIALAQQRASSFDQALARNRVQELTR